MQPQAAGQEAYGATRHHALHHLQSLPAAIEPAVQDDFFTQLQFDKGITAMLAVAGYDGVTASALASFKSLAEEYMMGFLATVSLSMSACRRGQPIPQDFALALAESGIEPSQLRDQLGLRIPDNVSCPEIFPPPPEEAASVDLRQMLGSSLCEATPITHLQIPSHFPPLPSQHTWRDTRQMAQREKDPRKIRERATQEGILAEQSLRKLAAAANKPHSRSNRTSSAIRENKQAIWQDALASVMPDGLQDTQAMDDDSMALDGAADTSRRSTRTPMVINYDRAHWRKGASFGAVRS